MVVKSLLLDSGLQVFPPLPLCRVVPGQRTGPGGPGGQWDRLPADLGPQHVQEVTLQAQIFGWWAWPVDGFQVLTPPPDRKWLGCVAVRRWWVTLTCAPSATSTRWNLCCSRTSWTTCSANMSRPSQSVTHTHTHTHTRTHTHCDWSVCSSPTSQGGYGRPWRRTRRTGRRTRSPRPTRTATTRPHCQPSSSRCPPSLHPLEDL